MSDSLSSLAKTVPTLKGTEIFTNWRRANTAYLLEKGAHRVLEGRETELLRDVHYIPAAQSNILLARQTAERRMDNQLARAHDAERQDQARHCLSRRPSLCPDPHHLSIGLSFIFKSQNRGEWES